MPSEIDATNEAGPPAPEWATNGSGWGF